MTVSRQAWHGVGGRDLLSGKSGQSGSAEINVCVQ